MVRLGSLAHLELCGYFLGGDGAGEGVTCVFWLFPARRKRGVTGQGLVMGEKVSPTCSKAHVV